jgi:hypothetical protein
VNAICADLTACADNLDCDGGNICATNTCCPAPSEEKPGICLVGECTNPAAMLIHMATKQRRNYIGGDTAAWSGWGEQIL